MLKPDGFRAELKLIGTKRREGSLSG